MVRSTLYRQISETGNVLIDLGLTEANAQNAFVINRATTTAVGTLPLGGADMEISLCHYELSAHRPPAH